MGLYPAITAHCVVLSQALLLGGTCGLPGHEEVAECDVHCPVSLQFALRVKRERGICTCRKLMWYLFSIMWKFRIRRGTCDEILFAVCLQSHTALCRGGGSEDGFDVLVRTFEHLMRKTHI